MNSTTNLADASHEGRLYPPPPPAEPRDEESLDVWGFRDTAFRVNARGHVEVTGDRYPDLSGHELPNLLPWFRGVVGLPVEPDDRHEPHYPPAIPEPKAAPGLLAELRSALSEDQISQEPKVRLRHGHGHTQADMFAIKHGRLPRVPDVVVYPTDEDQVVAVVEAAKRHGASIIPFGGGTNVTEALRCPADEQRVIVSLDTRRMNRILWIDPINRMACIQAGAVGRTIMKQLAEYGFTMGHEPDSVEFSTLGGWISTHASGMKKNRYGNIEDLVLDLTAVTSLGKIERHAALPRESTGLDPRRWWFGSEGNLGIITSAVVKLFPLPEVQKFGSVLFKDFEAGTRFMYDLAQTGRAPASVRLVDNLQFQFGIALKPVSKGFKALKSKLEKVLVTKVLGFEPDRMVACTLVFEGARTEVAQQEALVYELAKRHGGMKAGPDNGKRGYQLTYGIAYIRDFVMNHWFLAESFETSVPWSRVSSLCANVKQRIAADHAARNLPGKPFISCRVTQVYDTGAAVYFYFAYGYQGVEDPSGTYHAIEVAAREEVLANGGSLSHHHGVGKLRQEFLPRIMSPAALRGVQAAKEALDPQNVFGAGNLHAAEKETV